MVLFTWVQIWKAWGHDEKMGLNQNRNKKSKISSFARINVQLNTYCGY